MTIVGTNEAPVIAINSGNSATGTVTDTASATTLSSAGTLSFTDVDLTDTHTVSVSSASGDLGTLTTSVAHDSTGGGAGSLAWNYTVLESVAATLAAGQTKVDTFTITVNDGHGGTATQTISVTIVGTNEAPVIAINSGNSATGTVTDTASTRALSSAGTLSFTDVRSEEHTSELQSH